MTSNPLWEAVKNAERLACEECNERNLRTVRLAQSDVIAANRLLLDALANVKKLDDYMSLMELSDRIVQLCAELLIVSEVLEKVERCNQ